MAGRLSPEAHDEGPRSPHVLAERVRGAKAFVDTDAALDCAQHDLISCVAVRTIAHGARQKFEETAYAINGDRVDQLIVGRRKEAFNTVR